jgi:hypothetical protein
MRNRLYEVRPDLLEEDLKTNKITKQNAKKDIIIPNEIDDESDRIFNNEMKLIEELKQITNPFELNQRIRDLPDNRLGNNFRMYFSEKLYQMYIKQDDIDASLGYFTNRHNDLVQLKTDIIELHKLFVDFAMLVREQGSIMDNIELNVNKSKTYVEKAKEELQTATVYQKKSRKKMIIALGSLLGLVAIVGTPIAVTSALKK